MSHELPGSHPDHVGALQQYAREQLGVEVQAIGPAHRYVQADGEPAVWQVMTTIGDFWLVEHGGVVGAVPGHGGGRDAARLDSLPVPEPGRAAFLGIAPVALGSRRRQPRRLGCPTVQMSASSRLAGHATASTR